MLRCVGNPRALERVCVGEKSVDFNEAVFKSTAELAGSVSIEDFVLRTPQWTHYLLTQLCYELLNGHTTC